MAEISQKPLCREDVEVELDYAVASEGNRIILRPSEPGGQSGTRDGQFEKKKVSIANGRSLIGSLSLDIQGFEIKTQRTAVSDFYDEDQILTIYNQECENLVKEATGCSRAVVFDHTKRYDDPVERKKRSVREPVQGAHNDYTTESGPQRVRDLMGSEAETLLSKRFSIINIWRSTEGPVETMPLAICDARSVIRADLITAERRAVDRTGYTFRLAHNPSHSWVYFPFMQFDEVMLIKSYDSKEDGVARFTPHTAFVDPFTKSDALPRQSIESRIFAFF